MLKNFLFNLIFINLRFNFKDVILVVSLFIKGFKINLFLFVWIFIIFFINLSDFWVGWEIFFLSLIIGVLKFVFK